MSIEMSNEEKVKKANEMFREVIDGVCANLAIRSGLQENVIRSTIWDVIETFQWAEQGNTKMVRAFHDRYAPKRNFDSAHLRME